MNIECRKIEGTDHFCFWDTSTEGYIMFGNSPYMHIFISWDIFISLKERFFLHTEKDFIDDCKCAHDKTFKLIGEEA
jgi:hypothetical protein